MTEEIPRESSGRTGGPCDARCVEAATSRSDSPRSAGKTLADYEADGYLRAIVERLFITIGEALSRIARHDPNLFGDISEARSIVAFRNVLVHGYDLIDAEQVWAAITDDLSPRIT